MKMISVKPENGRVTFPSVNNWIDNFFETDFPFTNQFEGVKAPALVNTIETKDNFTLEVIAPGFSKEQLQINIEGNLLTITAEKEAKKLEEGEKYTRKEFNFTAFKRHFTLPKTVQTEGIKAEYKDGILYLVLPKLEEAKAKGPISVKVD